MGVAADCVYTSGYGSQTNATTHILTVWNTASALYKVLVYGFSSEPPRLTLVSHTSQLSISASA